MAGVYRLNGNSIWVQYSRLDGNSLQDIIAFCLFNQLYVHTATQSWSQKLLFLALGKDSTYSTLTFQNTLLTYKSCTKLTGHFLAL